MQKRLPKTRRAPEALTSKKLTERSLKIIETVARYRFIVARDIVRLVGGNEDVTHRHLQQLYHRDLISRFILPTSKSHGEFIYFVDNAAGLRQLCDASKLKADLFDWDEIARNRERYGKSESRSIGQFLFIEHELMISGFHANLEVAAQADGSVELERWEQGASLWNQVQVAPRKTLPHRPDALFSLRFPNAPKGQQRANFLYEADRGTSSLTKIREKLQAHALFLMQGKLAACYQLRTIRAVLVETLTEEHAVHIRRVVAGIAAEMPPAAVLFWISSSRQAATSDAISLRRWSCVADQRLRCLED